MKLIFQLIGVVFLIILGMFLLAFLMQTLRILATMAIGFLFFGIIIFLVCMLFNIKLGGFMRAEAKKKYSFKVLDRTKAAVPLFVAEPSVKDLVQTQQVNRLTELVLDGTILEVDNDSQVIVLEDTREKEAVRVRVSAGQFKGREGWVCRSVLHKYEDQNQKLLKG